MEPVFVIMQVDYIMVRLEVLQQIRLSPSMMRSLAIGAPSYRIGKI